MVATIQFSFSTLSRPESMKPSREQPEVLNASFAVAAEADDEHESNVTLRVAPVLGRPTDALFRTFAETPLTEEDMWRFVDEFNFPSAAVTKWSIPEKDVLVLSVRNESGRRRITGWIDEILDLRRCVQLWDFVCAGDDAALARHILWQGGSRSQLSVAYDSHPELKADQSPKDPDRRTQVIIISAESDSNTFANLKPGDVRAPAMLYVAQCINEHITGQVETRMVHVPQSGSTEMIAIPNTLLGGLWLQFAQAVAAGKKYARCKECQTWFETSLPGARKTRMYCSDLCKVKAYQGRKERAVTLRGEGWSPKEIADELGTDVATVKGWLKRKK